MTDLVGQIIAYEEGELSDTETVELFQHLVDTGMAWTLQGSYGRTARDLIEAGYVTRQGDRGAPVPVDAWGAPTNLSAVEGDLIARSKAAHADGAQ